MAPAYTAQSSTFTLPVHTSSDNQSPSLERVDSPFSHSPPRPTATSTDENGTNARQSGADLTSAQVDDQSVYESTRPNMAKTRQSNKAATTAKSAPLRFFVVDHPTKLKDKEQMRANRKHVMYDYLDKERRKPGSTDARVTGSGAATKKRKRLDSQLPGTSTNASAPCNIFIPEQTSTSATQSNIPERDTITAATATSTSPTRAESRESIKAKTTPRRTIRFAEDEAPLVRGIAGGFNNSRYLRTSADDVPYPATQVGSNLNPFDTWPALSDPLLDVEQLKWSCSRKFGSHGIAAHWVPTLLKAKHAFLSTICISSSHDDIMRRGIQAPHERLPHGSLERMKVRGEVIALINNALKDPQLQTADATIVAVLHLLNSEIMGCDDSIMTIHQHGLHDMVRQRGGLDSLGVDGQLASILTITMHIISALRETEPHKDFVQYAAQKKTKPPNNDDYRQLPESPVYCRLSGFQTVKRALATNSPTYKLLETLRLLTNSYVRGSGSSFFSPLTPVRTNVSWEQCSTSVYILHNKIFATKPAEEHPFNFKTMSEKYTFEAVRLVARVYAHALANEMRFSSAAAELSDSGTSYHILIKSALIRTDLSSCWDHMAGVLFWATLIAGACANPDAPSNKLRRGPPGYAESSEEEECRKWLAAIAVRCSIVLSFEHGGAILETLKRIVGIEQALAKAEEIPMSGFDPRALERTYGPQDVPFVQRTFQDFAQDFMDEFE